MTHDILQSDIELATRLRDDKRPDDEIITALVHRGVDSGQAAQLVDDLRNGRKAVPPSTAHLEFSPARRSRARSASHGTGQNHSTHSSRAESNREPLARPAVQSRKKSSPLWSIAAILIGLGIAVGSIVLFQRYHARTKGQEEQQPKPAMPKGDSASLKVPANAAAASQNVSPTPLVLELQPDGLHLGSSLVTQGNILAAAASLLGLPTRTNHVGQTDTVVYAYDRQGVLIYSQKGGGTNSIVLDYEAVGGANGTTSPFAGTLKIEDRVIGPDTDSKTLAAIKNLGLKRSGGSGSIWGGRYNNLELVFAYLKSPRRLSLIEIDLK
jgi:hypothetical protein